jgi:hypothetical protein
MNKLSEQEILNNSTRILAGAKAFRKDANKLMLMLANDFDFSLASTENFPPQVFQHKRNNKGICSEVWIYYFHGAECRFENLKTGQVIEMIIVTKPEFGFLDGYFFYEYMSTTNKFKDLAEWFQNYGNVWVAIELLANKGILTRITSVDISRNILAI